jgi:hypothetical protein
MKRLPIMLRGAAWLVAATLAQAAEAAPLPEKLNRAPANTWVELVREETGSRNWPMFVYHPGLGRYLLSGGEGSSHYDTEVFDPGSGGWSNLYPAGSSYKAASGPTDAPRVSFGEKEAGLPDKDGVWRIAREGNAWGRDAGTYFQWALCPADGRLYSYFQNRTLAFDPVKRAWSDLKAPEICPKFPAYPWSTTLGTMAWDPVNQEALWFGGTADVDGGSPGTWAFRPADGKWRRIECESKERQALRARAGKLARETESLVNALRNRCYAAETEAEAKVDLGVRAGGLAGECVALLDAVKTAPLTGAAKDLPALMQAALAPVQEGLARIGENGDLRERLLAGQVLVDRLQGAVRMLDAEPCGRGVAPMALDPVRGKILLFGGCRLDSYLADTWVYDCRTRTWEQRFPKISPAPRGGHTLVWLPCSGAFALYGATTFGGVSYGVPHLNPPPPQDLWTYDLAANEWKRLMPPDKDSPGQGIGAVGPNDELIFLARSGKGRLTFGMRIDPRASGAGSATNGVPPGSVAWCFNGPDSYDQSAKIEPDKIAKLLRELPANEWAPMPKQSAPCNGHEWGSSAYDATRHQIFFWGGGHSAWHYNDVSHYSLRTATWSIGYREEYPYPGAGFKAMYNQTFNNRPLIGSHIWDGYAYDTVADRLVVCARGGVWLYDPASRQWEYPRSTSPGELKVSMTETPRGAVMWCGDRLALFDAKVRGFRPLPMSGDKLGAVAYGDSTGICYDSKRNALWLALGGSPMYRYHFDDGVLTRLEVPPVEGVLMRETVYVPEIDMLLNVGRVATPGGATGNLAYDIAANRWVGLALPRVGGPDRANASMYSESLHYDPVLKVAIWLHGNGQEVLLAHLTREGLKTVEARAGSTERK